MKTVMEKVDVVMKLKEKIADARSHNHPMALQLQKLLDNIMADRRKTAAI
jgi:hypothetical protein